MARFIYLSIMLLLSLAVKAGEAERADSVATAAVADTVATDKPVKRNLIGRIINYFDDSNKSKPDKKVDFSVIGGPSYSNEAKFGIGLVAAAIYHTDMTDSLLQESNASLYGEVTTALLYSVGLRGNHIAPHDRFRINYDFNLYSFPTKFWGIGYARNVENKNETDYKDFGIDLKIENLWHITPAILVGPSAEFSYIRARDIEKNLYLWDGEPLTTTDFGPGLVLSYDTRDHLTNPYKGWLVRFDQRFFPRFLGNGNHSFSSTEVGINNYTQVWKGGVIASRLHGLFTYGHTPWGMLATIGGSYTMRGYYEARYRDKCAMDLTVELRQHVWKRSGIVVWAGVGSVFPSFDRLRFKELLPNCGIGYRWEFKKRTNVRLDFGIGKGQSGFIFNINEAF